MEKDRLKIDVEKDNTFAMDAYVKNFEHKNVVNEICKFLLKKDMSYIEMNAVLWRVDEALRYKAIHEKLKN